MVSIRCLDMEVRQEEANHAPFVYFGIDAKGGIGKAEESAIAYVRLLGCARMAMGPYSH